MVVIFNKIIDFFTRKTTKITWYSIDEIPKEDIKCCLMIVKNGSYKYIDFGYYLKASNEFVSEGITVNKKDIVKYGVFKVPVKLFEKDGKRISRTD